jgi:hypothetical protein
VKKRFPPVSWVKIPNSVVVKLFVKNWLIKAFSNDIFTLMTWFLFVLINQAKYYAQDTGNQYSILGHLICLPDCDKTSENESGNL